MDQTRYIEEISKYCDPFSMLVIGDKGQLMRIYCPFPAVVVYPVGTLEKGNVVSVEAVKLTLELKDVYIIDGKAYYLIHFRILL
jgi:hypothetical protein